MFRRLLLINCEIALVLGIATAAFAQTPKPYKPVFYDNDFSYIQGHDGDEQYLGDALKRRDLADTGVVVDAGGEYRVRHHDEHILNRTNDYLLHRTRIYTNVEFGGWFRAYAEGIDAVSNYEDAPPRGIDENRFDALNLFGEAVIWDAPGGELSFRAGRQEMLLGAQRLISPLDWSNTRRTFDGFRGTWKGTDWNIDGFWTRPVPFGQHVAGGVTDHNFDSPDQSREFLGLYASSKKWQNHKIDLYFLRLEEYDAAVTRFDYNTFGARWAGSSDAWLWEVEGGYQFGDFLPTGAAGQSHEAGFYTLGAGRKLDLPWNPVVWAFYDWASGDRDPTDTNHETFNHLFPLGHKYLGFMDLVGRQNIEDLNMRVAASPHEKVKLLLWFHIFKLQQARDSLYNVGGAPILTDATGASGGNVGQELDLMVKYIFSPQSDLVFGYSHLYSGDFIINQLGGRRGEDFYYGQFSVKF